MINDGSTICAAGVGGENRLEDPARIFAAGGAMEAPLEAKKAGKIRYILESKTVTPVECVHYAMNLPTSVVITGCDSMRILNQALNAARSFRPMKSHEIEALLAKTAQAARLGKYELYKTSHSFDGTWRNPEWLG
jgi:tyrosyl-tRNA synthetase